MDQRALPDSIVLKTPDSWNPMPLEIDEFNKYRTELVVEAAKTKGISRFEQRSLDIYLSNVYRIAKNNRIIFASGVFEYIESADGDEATPMFASVIVSTVLRQDLRTDIPLLPDVLVKAFSSDSGEEDSSIVFTHIEPPKTVTVGSNEAAKLVRMMRIDKPGRESQSQFVETYLVPVASGDAVFVLQFSTISLDYARDFSEVFGQIAQTLEVLYPSDPTPIGEDLMEAAESGE